MKTDSTIKSHWPVEIRERFLDFCRLKEFPYGRVLWTLGRMFVEGKIDPKEFGREYYLSSQNVMKNHANELNKSRINGDVAYELHKDLTNSPDSSNISK